jgi:hypothetical protein
MSYFCSVDLKKDIIMEALFLQYAIEAYRDFTRPQRINERNRFLETSVEYSTLDEEIEFFDVRIGRMQEELAALRTAQ